MAKQNSNPKNIEMGKAGRALRQMASNKSVRQRPCLNKPNEKKKFVVIDHLNLKF